MKKLKTTFLIALTILNTLPVSISFLGIAKASYEPAWTIDRPADYISFNESDFNVEPPERAENYGTDNYASVGIGVEIANYFERRTGNLYHGRDGVDLRVSVTANTRKAIDYSYVQIGLGDWVDPDDLTDTGITRDGEGCWLNLPFPVRFYGGPGAKNTSFTYTRVWVSDNGFLCFSGNYNTSSPQSLPDPAEPNAIIAVFWTDLNPSGGKITYGYSEALGIFVVGWYNVLNEANGARVTFEVIIEEARYGGYPADYAYARGQNGIKLLYQTVSGTGVAGVENQEGLIGTQLPTPTSGTGYFVRTIDPSPEIRELAIIAYKNDADAEIYVDTSHNVVRGHNMEWTQEQNDEGTLYEHAMKGAAVLLVTTAVGEVYGSLAGVSLSVFLLTLELASQAARESWPVNYMDVEDALYSENWAYINASAAYHPYFPDSHWPVDAWLSTSIDWVFRDDDGLSHTIELYGKLVYYVDGVGFQTLYSDPVTIRMKPDIGDTIGSAEIVGSGTHYATLDPESSSDFFGFNVPSGTYYRLEISMTPPKNADFDLYLYAPNGNPMEESTNGGNSIETIVHIVGEGTWYIEVRWRYWKGVYKLTIDYCPEPPPPGNGGSCPYVYAWDGSAYLVDNNVLALSEISNGSDVEDFYRVEQAMVPYYAGSCFSVYSLMLGEFENEHSFLDQIKLLAVDHESNVNVALTPEGQILTYADTSPPISAIDSYGSDVLSLLVAEDDLYYEGFIGDSIILDFGSLDISQAAKLVIRANLEWKKDTCIHVQTLNEAGGWTDRAVLRTRYNWSTQIVDLSQHLPNPDGSLKIRLYFTGIHRVDYIGLDTIPQQNIQVYIALPSLALHSENGIITYKLFLNDQDYAELLPGQQIRLYFLLPNTNKARTFVIYIEGHYQTIQ